LILDADIQNNSKGNLYAGALSPLSGAMLHNATLFYVNGAVRSLLHDPKVHKPIHDAFFAGAAVGLAATVVGNKEEEEERNFFLILNKNFYV
jgi:hypothetical protein